MSEHFGTPVARCSLDIALFALTLHVFHDVLRPLFGSSVVQNLIPVVTSTCVLATLLLPNKKGIPDVYVATLYTLLPSILHRLALWATSFNDPQIATVFVLSIPLFLISFAVTGNWKRLSSNIVPTSIYLSVKIACGIILLLVVFTLKRTWASLPFTAFLNPSALLVIFSWIHCLISLSSSAPRTSSQAHPRSKLKHNQRKRTWVVYVLPALCTSFTLFSTPTRPLSVPYAHPDAPLRVLSSVPSVTGHIVVGEELKHGLRYLRADHSILGGVWVGKNHVLRRKNVDNDNDTSGSGAVTDSKGEPLGDSIYSAFVLQEAARLQVRATPARNALIIGLGTGIAAQAFIAHNLSTTVVEIDPAVYDAARTYFGLPEPYAVYLEDARGWVERQSQAHSHVDSAGRTHTKSANNAVTDEVTVSKYDIVVHDCFSGGGVPEFLFTVEFWEELKKIVSQEGIVAVNYAGLIDSDSTRAVYSTLKQSFGQCRVFHDYYDSDIPKEKLMSMFINLVFFCTPSKVPLTFRPAETSDYLNSFLREHVLAALPMHEVSESLIFASSASENTGSWVLTDAHNPLGKWQEAGAKEHWKVMRQVLPDYVWFTY